MSQLVERLEFDAAAVEAAMWPQDACQGSQIAALHLGGGVDFETAAAAAVVAAMCPQDACQGS